MFKDIITYEAWHEDGDWIMKLYDVVFINNFGPFKKGQTFDLVFIDFEEGQMTACDNDGNELTSTRLRVIAH